MNLRAAFLECTGDLWLNVADKLSDERGWTPVYWTGAQRMRPTVMRRFPQAVFHDNTEAVKGRPPADGGPWSLPPIDDGLLADLSRTESIALRMMDRIDADGSFTYHERLELYYRQVRWASAVLDRLRPDVVVCSSPPHLVYDYVLYRLCLLRNVRTVVFNETAVNGLILASPTFEADHAALQSRYRRLVDDGEAVRPSPSVKAYLARIEGDYAQAVPGYVKDLYDYQPEGRPPAAAEATTTERVVETARERLRWNPLGVVEKIRRGAARIFAPRRDAEEKAKIHETCARLQSMLDETSRLNPTALRQALDCTMHLYRAIETEYPVHLECGLPPPETYLKQFGVPPEDSQLSYVEYWLFRSLGLRKKRELARDYDRAAQPPDFSRPYVYVPLHYQPEASTSPLGGSYVDQGLMIDLLSKTAPDGWQLYVKEHRFQFDKKGSGDQTRAVDFYRRIAVLPNVRIVAGTTSPFELIDHARAVATVTGTSGWEALLRGKPALVFGRAWYAGCDGALSVETVERCTAAFRQLEAGLRPDPDKVRLFLRALEDVGFRGYTIPDLSADAGVEPTENVRGFVEALCEPAIDPDAGAPCALPFVRKVR